VLESVREARAVVRRELGGHPAADAAVLAVSELAANAVRYTRSGLPGGTFAVAVRPLPGGAEVRVRDAGARGVPALASPGPGEVHGRGLRIVAALGEWGSEPARAGGRVTWCRIPARPARRARGRHRGWWP
jgi:anti-sigma regulatory factor (Ser/Thr protein kinase)